MSANLQLVRVIEPEPIMVVECAEPGGTFQRKVRLCVFSIEKLRYLYEKLKPFKTLFNDFVKDDPDAFVKSFVRIDGHGDVQCYRLVYEVDDVGILALTDIDAGCDAKAHFTFWDRRFRGREKLIRQMILYVMQQFDLHRVEVEIPLYVPNAIKFVLRLGFKYEGRRRQVVKYEGQWFDSDLFSILRHEVEELEAQNV